MNLHDADIHQLIRALIDSENMSLRVEPQFNGEINIELNAADGDSVQVRPICGEVLSLSHLQSVDLSFARGYFLSIQMQPGESLVQIEASLDQSHWHMLSSHSNDNIGLNEPNANYKYIRINALSGSIASAKLMSKG